MPSSDSEDFESADEGHSNVEKPLRKKRLSSSNYSDNALETEHETKNPQTAVKTTDGWDDFDIEESEEHAQQSSENVKITGIVTKNSNEVKLQENSQTKDTGWDEFDDWGPSDTSQPVQTPSKSETQVHQDIKEVTDRLAATSTKSSWGWGWGVDSLLSTATAGISTLSNQVSQGISTVLETSIGAPDPEELARQRAKSTEEQADSHKPDREESEGGNDAFQFGSLISGVTKFVETTGSKVLNSGLDTLETIGKKTMEVLQDGDPLLAKKRAMLGLETEKPVLSQVLREAKAKAEEEDRIREEKKEAKEVHYENLFDDFEGLVHLEALEMLSKQVSMRIEERLRSVQSDKRQEIKETLQQVAELCEMPEEDEDDDDTTEGCKADIFHERLQAATQDLGLKLQFSALVKQYTDILEWCEKTDESITDKVIYKKGVSGLAQATALSVELYHKSGEMLLVKTRRSTADEADALTQMTVVLTKHVSDIATLFTEKLNALPNENKDQIHNCITNIFLEAGNSSTYIQNAFQLALPILQIGAV